jgi:hypothetical protein
VAEDQWEELLHVASFAGMELDVLRAQDENGRDLAIYAAPHREGAELEDMGGAPRVTRCQIIFVPHDAADNHLERFFAFEQVKRLGETHTFTHPLTGSYEAKIGSFSWSAGPDQRDTVIVDCDFVEDSVTPAIFDLGQGAPLLSGVQDVAIASAELTQAVSDIETIEGGPALDVTVGTDALAMVQGWAAAASQTTRDVETELARARAEITAATVALQVATTVRRFPILRSLVKLEGAVSRAAEVFTDRTPRVVEFTVTAPQGLLLFCSRRYGAKQAQQRFDEIMRLNSIPNPARLEPGITLRGIAPEAPRSMRHR